jgi:hypothetical protein
MRTAGSPQASLRLTLPTCLIAEPAHNRITTRQPSPLPPAHGGPCRPTPVFTLGDEACQVGPRHGRGMRRRSQPGRPSARGSAHRNGPGTRIARAWLLWHDVGLADSDTGVAQHADCGVEVVGVDIRDGQLVVKASCHEREPLDETRSPRRPRRMRRDRLSAGGGCRCTPRMPAPALSRPRGR